MFIGMTRLGGLLLALVLVLAACGGGSDPVAAEPEPAATEPEPPATPEPTVEPTAEPTVEPTAVPTADAAPDSLRAESVDQVLDVVLDTINGDRELSEADYESFFAPSFRGLVPYVAFGDVNAQLSPLAPWTLVEPLLQAPSAARFLVESVAGDRFSVDIRITDEGVTDLLLQPWTEPPSNLDEALTLLEDSGEFAYLIAEITPDNECRRIEERDADRPMPLGSVFKLLVLGAVVDEVEAGRISWDDPVTIQDELDSYPSGVTQDVPAGETMTVQELAGEMISISDNTATDHLLHLVGRDTVEAAQAAWGIEDPSRNQPFLSTKELFQIKLDPELRDRYLAADVDERRSILSELESVPLVPLEELGTDWSAPIEIETLEWFATPADICRVLARLALDAEARAILELEPGPLPPDPERWARVGFKGGSEPGVLAAAYLLTDTDGRTFTLTTAVWNTDRVLDGFALGGALTELLDGFDAE
jgi:hypothetical protein